MRGVRRGSCGPVARVAVDRVCAEIHQRIGGDSVFLAVDSEALRLRGQLRDVNRWWDQTEGLVHDGACHATEEAGEITLVVPVFCVAAVENCVEVGLKTALGVEVHGEVGEGEMNGVCCCFMAGKDEDEGITEDFLIAETFRLSFLKGVGRTVTCALNEGCHQIHVAFVDLSRGESNLLRFHHLVHVFAPFGVCFIG